MKTVLFVPGFFEKVPERKPTIKAIESKGYQVTAIPINWRRTTIEDWVSELEKVYDKFNSRNAILAGFSFGAMTVLVAASQKPPSALWLFSLSPYFKEDMPTRTESDLRYIGKRRTATFKQLAFAEIAKSVKCKTLIFIGQKEIDKYVDMDRRSKAAHRQLKNSQLIVVPNAGHNVGDPNYIDCISSSI